MFNCIFLLRKWKLDFEKSPELCLVYFLAYIRLMKHYALEVLILMASRVKIVFFIGSNNGSVQGQDRREPNVCKRVCRTIYFFGKCLLSPVIGQLIYRGRNHTILKVLYYYTVLFYDKCKYSMLD